MIPWFQYVTVYLGPLPIRVWGFFVALGMVTGLLILSRRARRLGYETNSLLDQALWMIIFGLVVARLFHVLFYEPIFFWQNPLEVFKVWHGGLSSYGGFLGALLGFLWYRRRRDIARASLLPVADIMSFAALFGWLIGRLGCVAIHDHLGRACDCWLAIQTPDGPRLEMSILEIIALLPLALAFILLRKKKLPAGTFLYLLLMYYGSLRFVLDFFRATDLPGSDARYLGLTPAQYFSIIFVILGVYGLDRVMSARRVRNAD